MKYKKRYRKRRTVYGKSRERCVQCGEREYTNHTVCEWCSQPLCYKYAFGIIFLDCEMGVIQRLVPLFAPRAQQELITLHIPEHLCESKRIARLGESFAI